MCSGWKPPFVELVERAHARVARCSLQQVFGSGTNGPIIPCEKPGKTVSQPRIAPQRSPISKRSSMTGESFMQVAVSVPAKALVRAGPVFDHAPMLA